MGCSPSHLGIGYYHGKSKTLYPLKKMLEVYPPIMVHSGAFVPQVDGLNTDAAGAGG